MMSIVDSITDLSSSSWGIFKTVMRGFNITVTILLSAAVIGYLVAFITGLCRLSKNIVVRFFATAFVEILRGTSLIVQLFWLYYALRSEERRVAKECGRRAAGGARRRRVSRCAER